MEGWLVVSTGRFSIYPFIPSTSRSLYNIYKQNQSINNIYRYLSGNYVCQFKSFLWMNPSLLVQMSFESAFSIYQLAHHLQLHNHSFMFGSPYLIFYTLFVLQGCMLRNKRKRKSRNVGRERMY